MQRKNYGCTLRNKRPLSLPTVRSIGMSTDQSSWDIVLGEKAQHEGLQVLCISKPPTAPWESWSSRLFENEQPNSPATPSEDDSRTYFMEASQLPAEVYRCPEAYTQEAFIDVESEYCSEHDADKQDLHYRLLVGGLRSGRTRATNRPGSRKQIGKQAKLTRKPSKTRYAFQSMESSRPVIQQEASTGNDHSEFTGKIACMSPQAEALHAPAVFKSSAMQQGLQPYRTRCSAQQKKTLLSNIHHW